MASKAQIKANRSNAKKSTGPRTIEGKSSSAKNATKHGYFSQNLFLDSDERDAFDTLLEDLIRDLQPVGAIEEGFVERIGTTMWRQLRLNTAEGAMTRLNASASSIAYQKSEPPPYGNGDVFGTFGVSSSVRRPKYSEKEVRWAKQVLAEIPDSGNTSLEDIKETSPTVYAYLQSHLVEKNLDSPESSSDAENECRKVIEELRINCKDVLAADEEWRSEEKLNSELRKKALLLPKEDLELLSRYQTTLDNQLIKLLREFRDQQAWRMKTLDLEATDVDDSK